MSVDADVNLRRDEFVLDVAFRASDGELLVVAGPNGAGKTTLLRALAGLERISSGRISIDGDIVDDVSKFTPPHARAVALLPQQNYLLSHMSVADNVAFALPRPLRSSALEWLDAVGLLDAARGSDWSNARRQ